MVDVKRQSVHAHVCVRARREDVMRARTLAVKIGQGVVLGYGVLMLTPKAHAGNECNSTMCTKGAGWGLDEICDTHRHFLLGLVLLIDSKNGVHIKLSIFLGHLGPLPPLKSRDVVAVRESG